MHHRAANAKRRVDHRLGHVVVDHLGAIDLGVAVLLGAEREQAEVKVSFLFVEPEHPRRDRQHHHAVVEWHRVVFVRGKHVEISGIGDATLPPWHADEDGEKHIVSVGGHREVVLEQAAVAATGQLVVKPTVKVGVNLQVRVVEERVRVCPRPSVGDAKVKRRLGHRAGLRVVRRHAEGQHVGSDVCRVGEQIVAGTDTGQLEHRHQRLGMSRAALER